MNSQHNKDEKVIKDIIKHHVSVNNPTEDQLDIIIYYKSLKTRNLLMSNDMNKQKEKMLRTWTIYKYTCPRGDCELPNPTYIGQTRNTLRKRLTQHCKDGAIKEHNTKAHKIETSQSDLESNTIAVKQFDDLHRLLIYEALSILEERPDLNRQKENFVNPLKLYSRTLHRTQQNPQFPPPTQHNYNLRSTANR